jgi:hypothetical protein
VVGELCSDLRLLVPDVIVEHHMDHLGSEDAVERTLAMAPEAVVADYTFKNVEGAKQGCGGVAGMVMRLSGRTPGI